MRRSKWMEVIEEELPERHAELVELRRVNPMGFRKLLVKTAEQIGIYEYINRCSPRDLPTLEERRKMDEEERRQAAQARAKGAPASAPKAEVAAPVEAAQPEAPAPAPAEPPAPAKPPERPQVAVTEKAAKKKKK